MIYINRIMRSVIIKYKKAVTALLLLALPLIAAGQNQAGSEYYLDYGDPNYSLKVYYNAIPNRLFIQKSSDVSQDYIISLLSNIVGSQIDVSWCPTVGFQDDYCRVILDEALVDSVINELLKDEGVLIARRTYVEKEDYDDYVSFTKQSGVEFSEYLDSILMSNEIWFINEIRCYPYAPNPNGIPMDSICNEYGLTYDYSEYRFNVKINKNVDFFEIAHNLLETGCFIRVDVNRITPYTDKEMSFGDLPGSVINKADHFFFYWGDGSKSLYHEIPNRLFVQKSNDISKEYMVALLDGLIGYEYEIKWFNDAICEVIVDDDMSDDIINELLKDDGILLARHSFISKGDYDKYLYYPYLEKYEVCFCNDNIRCWFKDGYDRAVIDNLCLVLGLIIESENNTFVVFKSSKSSDIFEVLQKLFETGCFESIDAPLFTPYDTWNGVSSVSAVAQEKIYYNTSGRRTENPSGLTIVVTRYSDGTVRTEKQLFR